MATSFEEAIEALADAFGRNAEGVVFDEHARWDLYRESIDAGANVSLVCQALRNEPDLPLAAATVTWALERRDAAERSRWLEVLPPGRALDHAKRRADELKILEGLRDDLEPQTSELDVDTWTQWLQLRVAKESSRADVLGVLAVAGATKRIRRTAHERAARL